jgi:hypothetical protein
MGIEKFHFSVTTTDFFVCAFFFPEYVLFYAFFFFGRCLSRATPSIKIFAVFGNNRKNFSGSDIFLCGNTSFLFMVISKIGKSVCIHSHALL